MDIHNQHIASASDWREVSLWCANWHAAERLAVTALRPILADLEQARLITGWWFVRKAERWKLRYRPAAETSEQAEAAMNRMLTGLARDVRITRWANTVYEPEVHAFGGTDGMVAAHRLFHADSRHVLDHLSRGAAVHQRELALLLITSMSRAADLDWYEQGHLWRLVSEERAAPDEHPDSDDTDTVRRFLTADAKPARATLNADRGWFAAFENAGREYATLAERGRLTRGLRAVLAQHVLFAWNRLGIPAPVQGALAAAAGAAVFGTDSVPPNGRNGDALDTGAARVDAVTTDTGSSPEPTAAPTAPELRDGLADHIRGRATFRTAAVEQAFRTVPRELFLNGVSLEEAYRPRVTVTKRADDGSAISSASDPNLVATQAEDLDVRSGHNVLEIGAATGVNAALLAELTGPSGRVHTIEIDDDLADGARNALHRAGYAQVTVICGDGAAGWDAAAPFDRIIVTAGAWDISASWWRQLAVGGRIVVPLRLHGSGLTRSIAFDLQPTGDMTGSHARVCGFVPMRGAAAQSSTAVTLADQVTLNVDAADEPDTEALAHALSHPAHMVWTGMRVGDHEPVEHLDLWLATRSGIRFGRLAAGASARQAGLVSPALRWAGAALYDGGTIAYLKLRQHGPISDELGITAHGTDSRELAEHLDSLLREWNHTRPARPRITAYPAGTPDSRLSGGTHIELPDTRLTIAW